MSRPLSRFGRGLRWLISQQHSSGFKGIVDHVAIFAIALDSDQLQELVDFGPVGIVE
jgi:hypothetical protein